MRAPPPERETLRSTEAARDDPQERLLDAELDLRIALRLDQGSPLERRARSASAQFFALLDALPADGAAVFGGTTCLAAYFLARDNLERTREAMARGTRLAEAGSRVSDRVVCATWRGDLEQSLGDFAAAETAYASARAALSGHELPRAEREVDYSSALVAAARGDYARAYAFARDACSVVDRMLTRETEIDAREALLTTAAGFYEEAARFGIRGAMPAEAIAAAESGKALGYVSLLRGEAEIQESGFGAWLVARRSEANGDKAAIEARARSLGPDDAALSYLFLGADESGIASIAIGVLTRERIEATRAPYGAPFITAFHELPLAVRRNDTASALAAGKPSTTRSSPPSRRRSRASGESFSRSTARCTSFRGVRSTTARAS